MSSGYSRRKISTSGRRYASPIAALTRRTSALDRVADARRDLEEADGPGRFGIQPPVLADALERPLAEEGAGVGDAVGLVERGEDFLDQLPLRLDADAGRDIDVRDRHCDLLSASPRGTRRAP